MTRYYTNELSFELPAEAVEDRTLHLFEVPSDGAPVGLVVSRSSLGDRTLESALEGFAVLERTTRKLGAVEAIEISDRFRMHGGLFYRRSLHFALGDRWLQVSASGAFESRTVCDRQLAVFAAALRPRPDL
jgi:hypothetical protein